jgi:hypothetical protein
MKAFPRADGKYDSSKPDEKGMDLRDYFAAKALPALMHANTKPWGDHHAIHAEQAYKFADAMMKARDVLGNMNKEAEKNKEEL